MDELLMAKARRVSLAQSMNDVQDYTFSALCRVDDLIDLLQERVARLEAKPALEATPEPTPETVTISKAQWDTTQERIKNAINALWDISEGEPGEAVLTAKGAIGRDLEFEVALGL